MNKDIQQKLDKFFSNYKEVTYNKKEVIYSAGQEATQIFYIKTGYVRFFLSSEDGQEFTVRLYKSLDLLAFIPVCTGIPIEHTYASLTDLRCIRVSKEQFLSFLKVNPDILFELMKQYLISMNETMKRLEMLLMSNARKRILVVFGFLAEQIGELEKSGVTMPIGFTHQELAGFTGLTRETVTIEVDKLRDEEVIMQDKKIIKIKNIENFKKLTYV